MGLKVGDSYFNRDGYPGVILGRDPKSQALQVEKEGPNFEKTRRFGYINGLSPQERGEFEGIINEMREQESPAERMSWIHQQLDTMRQDPKKQVLTRYLEGEMAHIMNTEGISPRVYSIDENKV